MQPRIVDCPECGQPAEVIGRSILPSTDGPVEHTKVRCLLTAQWFFIVGAPERSAPARRAIRHGHARRGGRVAPASEYSRE